MYKEIKSLMSIIIKQVIVIAFILSLVTVVIGQAILGLIFSLGLLVATINFMLSGIFFNKLMSNKKKIIKYIFPLSYILRVLTVIIIAYPFIYDIKQISSYILGFTSFFIILIISWMKSQRGVSEWNHTKL